MGLLQVWALGSMGLEHWGSHQSCVVALEPCASWKAAALWQMQVHVLVQSLPCAALGQSVILCISQTPRVKYQGRRGDETSVKAGVLLIAAWARILVEESEIIDT